MLWSVHTFPPKSAEPTHSYLSTTLASPTQLMVTEFCVGPPPPSLSLHVSLPHARELLTKANFTTPPSLGWLCPLVGCMPLWHRFVAGSRSGADPGLGHKRSFTV